MISASLLCKKALIRYLALNHILCVGGESMPLTAVPLIFGVSDAEESRVVSLSPNTSLYCENLLPDEYRSASHAQEEETKAKEHTHKTMLEQAQEKELNYLHLIREKTLISCEKLMKTP